MQVRSTAFRRLFSRGREGCSIGALMARFRRFPPRLSFLSRRDVSGRPRAGLFRPWIHIATVSRFLRGKVKCFWFVLTLEVYFRTRFPSFLSWNITRYHHRQLHRIMCSNTLLFGFEIARYGSGRSTFLWWGLGFESGIRLSVLLVHGIEYRAFKKHKNHCLNAQERHVWTVWSDTQLLT